ncbi:DEAD/DEAH box helicase, partial [Amaricoccus sp.]|uniref:DEAD/DEAH box helicase n=1 Tax=Amaricoccus sp. TaxID=1872485 RepID=UPI00260B95BA
MITCRGHLPKAFARTLATRGFRRLTPVQRAMLRLEAADRDLLVSAGTGSGKTVAFGLMLARRLVAPGGRFNAAPGPRAIVVAPTRELAMQVRGELAWLFAGTGARVGSCTGGTDLAAERAALAAGLDLVVGTPGRLGRHLRMGTLDPGAVAVVVLDEADQMLAPDFRVELEALLAALPAERQTLMFSATVDAEVEALAARFQSGALRIAADAAGGFELQGVAVARADREAAVVNLLRLHEARAALVFCG